MDRRAPAGWGLLSHPSQKARRMGHPVVLAGREILTSISDALHWLFVVGCRHPWLFKRINLDVAEEDFGAFRLEEDFAAGGERVGSFVGQLPVHVLPHVSVAVHKFDDIPLPVRPFQFVGWVTKASHVSDFTLVEAVDPGCFAFRAGDAGPAFPSGPIPVSAAPSVIQKSPVQPSLI